MTEMADGWILAAAFLLALLGFAWLALAMRTHWRQVFGQEGPTPEARRRLRAAGTIALLAALALCLAADPVSMAALEWPMLLAAAATSVAGLLQSRPSMLRWLWRRARAS